MPELEGEARAFWCRLEERGETCEVLAQERRKLKEERPQTRPQEFRGADEDCGGFRSVVQLRDVRNALRRLEGKGEAVAHGVRPSKDELGGGHPIKSVVDFHRRKMLR